MQNQKSKQVVVVERNPSTTDSDNRAAEKILRNILGYTKVIEKSLKNF
jgi:hypothetical protein